MGSLFLVSCHVADVLVTSHWEFNIFFLTNLALKILIFMTCLFMGNNDGADEMCLLLRGGHSSVGSFVDLVVITSPISRVRAYIGR
jgi:hypothetical protein